ncbi:Condensation domain protein [Neorhodopirellula pilleata]|uniref:Condensation domain protein n=2 Tax=Neorhodopirellula pilleata TaxID=2714738 RepID=A0A5C5ZZJ1_9BACT|nr:Condensation domain protein [Neorhodopirellula pilleata]
MVFEIVLILVGPLDLDRLRQAWIKTIQRHPRMFARLRGHGRRQYWESQPHCDLRSFVYQPIAYDHPSQATFAGPAVASSDNSHIADPRSGLGIRCFVQSDDQRRWSVRLVFHHACCDGVGAIRVFGQFAKRYADPVRLDDRQIDSIAIGRETEFHGDGSRGSHQPPATVASTTIPELRNLWTTIRGSNIRLSRHARFGNEPLEQDDDASFTNFGGHRRLLFSQTRSAQIKDVLKAVNVKLNDWAIGITMMTLAGITEQASSPSRHLMILNPVETRHWADRHDTRNHIGLAFLRRTHEQLRDPDTVVRSISDQMSNVRHYGTAAEMEFGIAIAETIPGGLRFFERLGTFTPTATLTSLTGLRLGKRFGVTKRGASQWIDDVEIQDIYFDAPIQIGAELSIAVWDYDGRLSISCRTGQAPIALELASRFLEKWSVASNRWLASQNSLPESAF